MSYEEKDFVALDKCPICNEARGVVIHKQLRKTLPKELCIKPKPCDKCIKDLEENNAFIMYECRNEDHYKPDFTGRWVKCNLAAFNFPEDTMNFIKENRFMCATEENFNFIINKAKENGEIKDENDTQ